MNIERNCLSSLELFLEATRNVVTKKFKFEIFISKTTTEKTIYTIVNNEIHISQGIKLFDCFALIILPKTKVVQ